MVLKTFGWSFGVTAVALIGSFVLGGPTAFALVAILCVLEISLSFDNAVVNATILERMNAFWQRIFLTIGILIAVFGMRLLFPLLIVGITASLGPIETVQLALEGGEGPESYGGRLEEAHPQIASFGGMFLLMLFLDWVFEDRDIKWLSWFEKPLARAGKLDTLAVIVGLAILTVAAEVFAEDVGVVMVAGVLGVVVYLAVNGLGDLFEGQGQEEHEAQAEASGGPSELAKASGKAAFFLFLYLEVLDASFSFDGVIGAFAITDNIFIIAVGLGVGAMYIRSITVYLVRQGTLDNYVYLEHGAHWAIGALAAILLISLEYEVPEIITGLIGVGFIGVAFINSITRNRREIKAGHEIAHVTAKGIH